MSEKPLASLAQAASFSTPSRSFLPGQASGSLQRSGPFASSGRPSNLQTSWSTAPAASVASGLPPGPAQTAAQEEGVLPASQLFAAEWSLDALSGRFSEISGDAESAALTAAARLILQAQQRGEPSVWVSARSSTFFPPDFASSGIDLRALPIVFAGDGKKSARAADALLRSNGFSLVVLDLGLDARLSVAVQARLAGLAKKHHAALVCLTRKGQQTASLGSLVSIRGEFRKKRASFDRFLCELHVVKDKRRGPGWGHKELCCGPGGLC